MDRTPPFSGPPPFADANSGSPMPAGLPTIQIHNHVSNGGWAVRVLAALLVISAAVNLSQWTAYQDYQSGTSAPYEKFVQGKLSSHDKLALLEIEGVIMPPYTDRILKVIEKIEDDDKVRGAVVVIDSPGGLVADSHRIYKALQKLHEKKPLVVSMGRIAASGGYYVAMGGGPETPIFAEEITWTGSIGVIIPRYDLSALGEKIGVRTDPLMTGPLKDALDPFKPLSDQERQVWDVILAESFDKFVDVIASARRELTAEDVRKVATGQVYTADQALKLKLIDRIGDRDDAIEALKEKLQLKEARVIRYEQPKSLSEQLLGVRFPSVDASADPLARLLDLSVPRAMYLFGVPGLHAQH